MLSLLFMPGLPAPELLWAQHDPALVMLSIAMAIISSTVALHMAALARKAPDSYARHITWSSGALMLGGGIWAMHFIGMLAYSVCANASFSYVVTLVSLLPGVIASWVAMGLLMRETLTTWTLILGGVAVGLGIGTMHYVGMAASELLPSMRLDPYYFAASIVVAAVLAILALWVRFGLKQYVRWSAWLSTLVAGTVMGFAIAGMHYMGMAALRFDGDSDFSAPTTGQGTAMSLGIVAVILLGTGAIAALNVALRYRHIMQKMQVSESRMRALAETALDGIIMIDARGIVQSFNTAAQRMLGWEAHEVIGRNVNMLMPEPHHSAHDGYIGNYMRTGEERIIGASRDVSARRKDGRIIPIRLAVGRVRLDGPPLFVGFITDLSVEKGLVDNLRRNEEQLRSLVSNIPGVTFRCSIDMRWTMHFISDAVESLTGYAADQFLDGSVNMNELIHPDDIPRLRDVTAQAVIDQKAYQIEYRVIDKAGETHWVSEMARGMPNEQGSVEWIDGVIMDVTQSRARNAEFESTVNAVNRAMAVCEFDLHGNVLKANEKFLGLVGYRMDEVVGRNDTMFCSDDEARSPEYARLWRSLAQGVLASGEYVRKNKMQREVWVQATFNPVLNADGTPFKVVLFATDLTMRRNMEQEMRMAKERAEEAAASRSSFLANMSHEIRTPMNAIIGFTEALLDTPLQGSQKRYLTTVQQAARSMLHLLNDILDMAKLEKGAVELEVADFSLDSVCDQIMASLSIQANKKGLVLSQQKSDSVPAYLRGDALRLQQVLLNLLGNALKFTEHGAVTLWLDYQGGVFVAEVEDTGIGIDAQKLERIFDPFAQADVSTTRKFGGTGLGTTISRQLVELMGGDIRVRSILGQGSVFTVRVPMDAGVAPPVEDRVSPQQLPALRVLAADDVPANLELLQIHFGSGGHTVVLANDGFEAFAQFKSQAFDVILMDLQMPGLDGFQATRKIREWERLQGDAGRTPVPIVALSASVLEQDRRAAVDAGMNGFASKPLEPERLFTEIARVIGLQRMGHSSEAAQGVPVSGVNAGGMSEISPSKHLSDGKFAGLNTPDVDWLHGEQRWTQAALHHGALQRFLVHHQGLAEDLRSQVQARDYHSLADAAHRVRGAAGNLGLLRLSQLIAQIEKAARSEDGQTLETLVWEVPQAMAAIKAQWDMKSAGAVTQGGAAAAPAAVTGAAALSAEQQKIVRQAVDALQHALSQSELSQTALDILGQVLSVPVLAPLNDALDNFDFDKAQRIASDLRAHWTTPV